MTTYISFHSLSPNFLFLLLDGSRFMNISVTSDKMLAAVLAYYIAYLYKIPCCEGGLFFYRYRAYYLAI